MEEDSGGTADIVGRLSSDSRFLPEILETLRDGVLIIDAGGFIRLFNRAAEEMTGYRRREVVGKDCAVLQCDACTLTDDAGTRTQREPERFSVVRDRRCTMRSADGRPLQLIMNALVLRDADGEAIVTVESLSDVTSLQEQELELQDLKEELSQDYWFMGLLGKSVAMQRLSEHIRNAAASEAPVLIIGESGSGKNLVARAIHKLSRRKDGPLLEMNCASLNEQLLESELFGHKKGAFTGAVSDRAGRFEAAHQGSFFLDEIGDMPLAMQAKLLRVLEEREVERVGDHTPIQVDIRLLSATNKDLGSLLQSGRFREDLLYRVNSIIIKVPPLRERREDIPLIALHYLRKISAVNNKEIRSISPAAMERLTAFPWPGNVRRLINTLEHAAATCKGDTVDVRDLPDYLAYESRRSPAERPFNQDEIRSALSLCKGSRTLAAKHLGISRVTLWKRLKAMGEEE
ncbi:MAG TPA: sigma 54-interacting transcriptional regulator [Candidatus Methanoperedens sp.]|nr:sigma 54-interacting transcriptional regulator [Candidatus Methanoperedens sp.]